MSGSLHKLGVFGIVHRLTRLFDSLFKPTPNFGISPIEAILNT